MVQSKNCLRMQRENVARSDPELKTTRQYANYAAEEVRADLIGMGYAPDGATACVYGGTASGNNEATFVV